MISQQQYTELCKRKYSAEQRRQLASEGKALPDGSFPIVDEEDLGNAIDAVGLGQSYSRARQHIIKRARALGKTSMLPEKWAIAKSDAVLSGLNDQALLRAHLEIHKQGAGLLLKSGRFSPGLVHRHHWLAREMEARGLDHQLLTHLDKAAMTSGQLGTMGGGTGVEGPNIGPGSGGPQRRRRRPRRRGPQQRYQDFDQIPADLSKDATQPTMEKDQVDYRQADPGTGESCGTCSMFQDTGSGFGTCTLVKGPIAADYVCNEFDPADSSDNALEGPDNGSVGTGDMDDMSKGLVKVQLPLRELRVLQKDNRGKQRFTLAVAYPADDGGDDPDSQGEYAPSDVVEQAAWWFMHKGRQSGVMHIRGAEGEDYGTVVESYIYRNEEPWVVTDASGKKQTIKKGDWLVGQIWTPKYHNLIEKGQLRGISIQGTAMGEDIPDPLSDWMRY